MHVVLRSNSIAADFPSQQLHFSRDGTVPDEFPAGPFAILLLHHST
jgi:hypothetical protein